MPRELTVCMRVMVVVLALVATVAAQRHEWIYLGGAHVDGHYDHNKIKVERSQGFRALQFRVEGAAVEFQRVVIHYTGSAQQELPFSFAIPNSGSRSLDLRGNVRSIAYVELWYTKAQWANRPKVNMYGMP